MIGSLEFSEIFCVTEPTLKIFIIWSNQYMHAISPSRKVGTHQLG